MQRVIALLLFSCCVLPVSNVHGQQVSAPDAGREEALRIYMDCRSRYCDSDFFRTEVAFVNYVRDRHAAEVHVLITTQRTGSGGTEFTVNFIGQRKFAGKTDTLQYAAEQMATRDDVRQDLAHVLKLGLVRYVARSPVADEIRIAYDANEEEEETAAGPEDDPWNHWVFRASVRGFLRGESTTRSSRLNGSFSARRVTEDWKMSLRVGGGYDYDAFEVEDRVIRSEQKDYSVRGLLVHSAGGHWSTGVRASAAASPFRNQAFALRFAPAVEYSVFPYSESTRRELRLLYTTGASAVEYEEETVYLKTEEMLVNHELRASFDMRQPWGSAGMSLEGSQYLHDLEKYRVSLDGRLDLRLTRGLSLNVFASTSWLNDQLYLRRGEASEEEVLLRRTQLATSYRYVSSIGISYTFGSIYNNVVNSRF